MFTGVVEAVAKAYLRGSKLFVERVIDVGVGESVAVNGVCLTVSSVTGNYIVFDVGEETLERTNLSKSQFVNLERAMRLCDRVGGHIVLGHVDGTVRVRRIVERGNTHWIAFEMPKERYAIVEKGSIALNGVSLTIAKVENDVFWVQVVPYTWRKTNLSMLRVGDEVNYEIDVFIRYLYSIVKGVGMHGCRSS